MGIQERKLREREELKGKIITTATDLFREKGYASVSMREIAKRVEYSVGTLYLLYRDKDELFLAVQDGAFQKAFAYMSPALEKEQPLERLRELGRRYIQFGIANPDLYRLMFMMEHPMQALERSDDWSAGITLHELLSEIVRECIASGNLGAADPGQTSFVLWSMVHGMVSLKIANRLDIYNGEHVEGCPLCGNTVEDVLAGYEQAMNLMMSANQS